MAAGNQGITVIGMAAQFALAGGVEVLMSRCGSFSGKTGIVLTPGLPRRRPAHEASRLGRRQSQATPARALSEAEKAAGAWQPGAQASQATARQVATSVPWASAAAPSATARRGLGTWCPEARACKDSVAVRMRARLPGRCRASSALAWRSWAVSRLRRGRSALLSGPARTGHVRWHAGTRAGRRPARP